MLYQRLAIQVLMVFVYTLCFNISKNENAYTVESTLLDTHFNPRNDYVNC